MADSAETPTGMQKTIECSVCLLTYDLENHLPKALRCLHTFCKSCIEDLCVDDMVKCPKCREETASQDVKTNYIAAEMVEALCGECKLRSREVICRHCDSNLCQNCCDIHMESFPAEVTSNVAILKGDINSISEMIRDLSDIKAERVKTDVVLKQIRERFMAYHEALDRCQAELESAVFELEVKNMSSLKHWRETLQTKVTNARIFVDQAERNISTLSSSADGVLELVRLRMECCTVTKALKISDDSFPEITNYHFKLKDDVSLLKASDIGEFLSTTCHGVRRQTTRGPNYTTAVVKHVMDRDGKDVSEFNRPPDVAVTANGYIIVTDQNNHRIKIHDDNYTSLSTLGDRGTTVGKYIPIGIAVSSSDKVYVSDQKTNRILVLTMVEHTVDTCKALDINGLNKPEGLTFDSVGNLYICNRGNHNVLAVQADGTYLHSIDSEQFDSEPIYVVCTNEGKVLISQLASSAIKVFNTTGSYIESYPKNAPASISDMLPRGMVIDDYGNIIVADGKGRLVVLDQDGNFTCTIGSEGQNSGQLSGPLGVAINKEGNIIVCDYMNNRLQVFGVQHYRDK